MAYLRGDLEPEEAERWSAHVAKCEACRQRLIEVSALVDDVRQQLMFGDVAAQGNWPHLERILQQESAGRLSAPRLRWLNPKTIAVAAASLIVIVAVFWSRGTSVSAAEILERASVAERVLQQEPGKVVHRVMTVEERRGLARTLVSRRRVEAWRKTGTTSSARRAFDEAGRVVAAEWIDKTGKRTVQTPEASGLQPATSRSASDLLVAGDAWQIELSASSFASVIPSPALARVTETAAAISLYYESDDERAPIAAAMLMLSASDLHAIEQTIQIGHGEQRREYRIAEDRLSVLAADAVAASVFEPEVTAPEPRKEPAPRAAAIPRVVSPTRLLALEIEALRLLDGAGALLGEQVNVSRTSNQVRIHALVDSEERKLGLERAMQPLARERGVDIDIQTFAAAAQRQPDGAAPLRLKQVDISTRDIPAGPQLRRYFGAAADQLASPEVEEKVRAFASQAVEHSALIVQHAWAMKRLQSRYSPQELVSLDASARQTWRQMIAGHASLVIDQADRLRAALQPVFFPSQQASTSPPSNSVRTDDAGVLVDRVVDLAQSQDHAVRTALSASSVASNSGTFIETSQFRDQLNEVVNLAKRIHTSR